MSQSESLYNTSSGVNFQNPIVSTESFQSEISGQTGVLNWEALAIPNMFSALTRTGVQWQGQLNEMIKNQNNGEELSWLTSEISQNVANSRDAKERVNAVLATIGNTLSSETFQVNTRDLSISTSGSEGQSMTMLEYLKFLQVQDAGSSLAGQVRTYWNTKFPNKSVTDTLDVDSADPTTLNNIMELLDDTFYISSSARTAYRSADGSVIAFNNMPQQLKDLKAAYEVYSKDQSNSAGIFTTTGALHDYRRAQNDLWDAFLFSLFDVDETRAGSLSQERIDAYNTGRRGDMLLSFQTERNSNDGTVIHRPVIRFASHVSRARRILLHKTLTASGIAQEYTFSRNGAIYNQSSINSETYSDPRGQNAYGGEGNDTYHFLELRVSGSGATYAFQASGSENDRERFFNPLYRTEDPTNNAERTRNQKHAFIGLNSALFGGVAAGKSTFSYGSFLNTLNDEIATMDQADIATLTSDVQLLAMLKALMELTESYVSVVHKFLAKKAQQQASS